MAAVGLTYGPCEPWCSAYDVRAKAPFNDVDRFSVADVELARAAASSLMFQAGGRRWPGPCTDTVRPDVCVQLGNYLPLPVAGGVGWVPVAPHDHRFCCSGGQALELGGTPVISVEAVRVDGEVLAAAAYEIRDWRYLVRVDGEVWPCCNVYNAVTPTLEVDYTFGTLPPPDGRIAAIAVARQLLLAFADDGECALGENASSITRENVTIELAAPDANQSSAVYEQLPEVAAFVGAQNPNRLRRSARFLTGRGSRVHRNTTPVVTP